MVRHPLQLKNNNITISNYSTHDISHLICDLLLFHVPSVLDTEEYDDDDDDDDYDDDEVMIMILYKLKKI